MREWPGRWRWSDRWGGWAVTAFTLALLLPGPRELHAQNSPGVVAEVRVHGNHTTPDADVLAIAGEVIGHSATDALVAAVSDRPLRSRASRCASAFARSTTPATSC